MSFDLAQFHAVVDGLGGLQQSAKFRVRAFPPLAIDSRFFEFTCFAADLPGLNIVSVPVRTLGYGNMTDAPLVPAYGEASLQCFVDNSGRLYELMTAWQQAVINYNYAPGGATAGQAGGAWPFQVSYAEDYVGAFEIETFSQEGFSNRLVTLHDAWPRAVGQIQHSWAQKDTLTVLPVQLAFRSWTSSDMAQNSLSTVEEEDQP